MKLICGLTSTRPETIPAFLAALESGLVATIALFPTCLASVAREKLYRELERLPKLQIPHVHLRSDCDLSELEYLHERFRTEAFNIHPAASSHGYGSIPDQFRKLIFIENVEVLPTREEIKACGGLCPDFSHIENARLWGRHNYVKTMHEYLTQEPVGCCHLSAIRIGQPNRWSAEWDQHNFIELSDFDYLEAYRQYFTAPWGSLELENSLEDQLRAAAYIARRFGLTVA